MTALATVAALLLSAEPGTPEAGAWSSDIVVLMEPDGASASVTVRTTVPLDCYEAAGTTAAPPPGEKVRKNLPVVTVFYRTIPGRTCRPRPESMEQRHERLDLKTEIGIVHAIRVIVVADGKVMNAPRMTLW